MTADELVRFLDNWSVELRLLPVGAPPGKFWVAVLADGTHKNGSTPSEAARALAETLERLHGEKP